VSAPAELYTLSLHDALPIWLNDSMKLTAVQREALFPVIQERALAWAIGRAEVHEIDQLNILHATMLAMQRAVAGLAVQPDRVLVDRKSTRLNSSHVKISYAV